MSEENRPDTLSRLLAAIDANPGFAGLGASVQTITRLVDDDDGNSRELAAAILRDAALTSRLLQLSNSPRFSSRSRNVTTVDQSIAILGLNTVKSTALSLALLDGLSGSPQARLLQAEIVAAYFCGSLCSELTRLYASRFNPQEAQVCGLMQNLGRMMAIYYLNEEIERSRKLQADENLLEDEAVQRTLGVDYQAMGGAITAHWHLPDIIQQSLAGDRAKLPAGAATDAVSWHQRCALFSRSVTNIVFRLPENRCQVDLPREVEYFRTPLGLRETETQELIQRLLVDTDELLAGMGFPCTVEEARDQLRKASERVTDMLSTQDSLTKEYRKVDGKTAVELLQQALRLYHDHFGFDRTLLCLPSGSALVAVAGVGRNTTQIIPKFRCQGNQPDIFRLVLAKKVDLYVPDRDSPSFAKFVPAWFAETTEARAFAMLSLIGEGQALGLLYGDYAEPPATAPVLAAPETQAWRQQLVTALLLNKKPPTT